jgi:hypothetical protein
VNIALCAEARGTIDTAQVMAIAAVMSNFFIGFASIRLGLFWELISPFFSIKEPAIWGPVVSLGCGVYISRQSGVNTFVKLI